MESMVKEQQEMKNAMINVQQILEQKVDLEQLKKLMHDKSDSTKNLKRLEKQLRSLYEVLYSQIGASDEDEDPLLGKKTMPAYQISPYDKKITSKENMSNYPVWKKPPTKKIQKRIKHPKDMNRMGPSGNPDSRTMKYNYMGAAAMHNTQPDFYDPQEANMIRQYQQQNYYNSGSEGER